MADDEQRKLEGKSKKSWLYQCTGAPELCQWEPRAVLSTYLWTWEEVTNTSYLSPTPILLWNVSAITIAWALRLIWSLRLQVSSLRLFNRLADHQHEKRLACSVLSFFLSTLNPLLNSSMMSIGEFISVAPRRIVQIFSPKSDQNHFEWRCTFNGFSIPWKVLVYTFHMVSNIILPWVG